MNLELNALGTMINKITTGKITEVNYPWFDKYINLFYEVENNVITAQKKVETITFTSNQKQVTVKVNTIRIDKFMKYIPVGFKKGDLGITIEFSIV
jgi:hypothetical protein